MAKMSLVVIKKTKSKNKTKAKKNKVVEVFMHQIAARLKGRQTDKIKNILKIKQVSISLFFVQCGMSLCSVTIEVLARCRPVLTAGVTAA